MSVEKVFISCFFLIVSKVKKKTRLLKSQCAFTASQFSFCDNEYSNNISNFHILGLHRVLTTETQYVPANNIMPFTMYTGQWCQFHSEHCK